MKLKIVLKRKREDDYDDQVQETGHIMKRKREDDYDDQVQETGHIKNRYGDGVAWRRGAMLGQGSFGSVYLAITSKRLCSGSFPSVVAVKSAELSVSQSIQEEKEVLSNIQRCPNIIRCFGEEITVGDNGSMAYNLLLEYASGGSLADRINKAGNKGLPESEVRCYTRSILKGLNHIHGVGYVHCDLKPENILLLPKSSTSGSTGVEFVAKICDLGLAKRVGQHSEKWKLKPYWRGTPMFLSPEAAIHGVQDTRSDIWSLGCIVLEMLTGKPAWNVKSGPNAVANILKNLQKENQTPKIPRYLSQDAKGFIACCLKRNVNLRLSAKTLLTHPFVEAVDGNEEDDGFEEDKEIEDINQWSSEGRLVREQSCCFQTPPHNRPYYQYMIA